MFLRRILHIPRHTLRLIVYTILALGLVFIGLTRTRVGRAALRDQMEKQFASAFAGTLQIGELQGNLVQTLYASDIVFLDEKGQEVLVIDSLVAHPSWLGLLQKRFEVEALEVYRPRLVTHFGEDSTWSLAKVFRPASPRPDARPSRWSLESADLLVVDGYAETSHGQTLPKAVADGVLFDFAQARFQDIQLRGTLEWRSDNRFIDIFESRVALPDQDFSVDRLSGQVILEGKKVFLNQIHLEAEGTEIRLDGEWTHPMPLPAGGTTKPALDVYLQPSVVDARSLRRLFPTLPLDGTFKASAQIHGPFHGLVVETATFEKGQTSIQAEGTLEIASDSIDFELGLRNSTLHFEDLETFLPTLDLPDLAHLGPLSLDLTATGKTASDFSGVRLAAAVDLQAEGGNLAGNVSLQKHPATDLQYRLDLAGEHLNLPAWIPTAPFPTLLNGQFVLTGQGLQPETLQSTLQLALTGSRLDKQDLDSLRLEVRFEDFRLEATAQAHHRDESANLHAVVSDLATSPHYALDLTTRQLDLGLFLPTDTLSTSLNAQWHLEGSGLAWETAAGILQVDIFPSTIAFGASQRALPAHRAIVQFRPPDQAGPRLEVGGDLLSLVVETDGSDAALPSLASLVQLALTEAIERQQNKPFERVATAAASPTPVIASLDQIRLQENLRQTLASSGSDSLRFSIQMEMLRSDILSQWLPLARPIGTNIQASLDAEVTAEKLDLHLLASGDSLCAGDLRLHQFDLSLDVAALLGQPLEQGLASRLVVVADTLSSGQQRMDRPVMEASLDRQKGHVTFSSETLSKAKRVDVDAAFSILPTHLSVEIDTLQFALGEHFWQLGRKGQARLYSDATVFSAVSIEGKAAGDSLFQRIHLGGVLSTFPQDTLDIEVEGFQLKQWSDFLSLNPTFSGQASGRFALTNLRHPEVTGTLLVDGFAVNDWGVGRLTLTSLYETDSPAIALNLKVEPLDAEAPPRPGIYFTENRLTAHGTFRLPRRANGLWEDPGLLDLDLDAERIDAYFFKLIFTDLLGEVRGAFSGRGKIGGTITRPVFDTEMTLADGYVTVPLYNLAYQTNGPVSIDPDGIRLQGIDLTDPTGGTATLTGSLLFNEYRFFSLDLVGSLDRLQIMNVANDPTLAFYGRIWASGTATLTGPIHEATLLSNNATTTENSEIFIPLTESSVAEDPGFIVFTDSSGQPLEGQRVRRKTILSSRPLTERSFTDGLEMDLNIYAPEGSIVHLVIDPLLGDVINAVGSGRVQLQRREGEFYTFGTIEASAGDYLFTAGEVFVRTFLIQGGTITWDGDPLNARLDIQASYKTRASRSGLPPDIANRLQSLIPLVVRLAITGRVASPEVQLNLEVDRSTRQTISNTQFLETYLNEPDLAAQHATSVLLTNSFLLSAEGTENYVLTGSAFNSVSQLVSSQLNRYLSQVLPNADFSFGVQGDEAAQDLDVTAGLALSLLNDRLLIRGQGIYRAGEEVDATTQQGLQGEFVVEVHLNPNVSVEVFYRREGDVFSESLLTSSAGASLSYQTRFSSWKNLLQRIFNPKHSEPTTANNNAF